MKYVYDYNDHLFEVKSLDKMYHNDNKDIIIRDREFIKKTPGAHSAKNNVALFHIHLLNPKYKYKDILDWIKSVPGFNQKEFTAKIIKNLLKVDEKTWSFEVYTTT